MIRKQTLTFLKEIAENNNREWFAEHKSRYEAAKDDVLQFAEKLISLLAAIDPEFPADTPAKKCLLRIYRDVRFSKNKDPYKSHYGISFRTKTKDGNEPEYYLHIQPEQSFLAAGFWMPEAPVLKKIREEIDYNTSEFLGIINAKPFKTHFKLSEEDKLKNGPKGYESDHPQIELLKLKSFIAICSLQDDEFLEPEIVDKLKTAFAAIHPFIVFLRNAVAE